jgi:hypothetical protein
LGTASYNPFLFYFLLGLHLLLHFVKKTVISGVCSSIVGGGNMLQAGRSRVRFLMRSLDFINLPNPSGRTMALGSTRPLTEMSTRNLPGGNGWLGAT